MERSVWTKDVEHQELKAASEVINGLKVAAQYGLEAEVMMYFIRYLNDEETVSDAIDKAVNEWIK